MQTCLRTDRIPLDAHHRRLAWHPGPLPAGGWPFVEISGQRGRAFGCTLGILPHVTAAMVGLGAVLCTIALAFETLKYLGVGYLLLHGWRTAIRDLPAPLA